MMPGNWELPQGRAAGDLPPGCLPSDIEGPQESDDEATERYFERGDAKLDLQDADVAGLAVVNKMLGDLLEEQGRIIGRLEKVRDAAQDLIRHGGTQTRRNALRMALDLQDGGVDANNHTAWCLANDWNGSKPCNCKSKQEQPK